MKNAITAAIVALVLVSPAAAQDWTGTYMVTVTNLTSGQHFTPIIAATHGDDAYMFMPGMPATEELEMLAEGGDTMPMAMMLNGMAMSIETTMGLLGPGMSTEFRINGGSMARYLSLAAMMIPTNDGFVGLRVMLSGGPEMRTYYAYGYDAGTEENDEDCHSIPGPPYAECSGDDEAEAEDDHDHDHDHDHAMAEGHVSIHRGIQGVGDFGGDRDWRNPVAMVMIRRIS